MTNPATQKGNAMNPIEVAEQIETSRNQPIREVGEPPEYTRSRTRYWRSLGRTIRNDVRFTPRG